MSEGGGGGERPMVGWRNVCMYVCVRGTDGCWYMIVWVFECTYLVFVHTVVGKVGVCLSVFIFGVWKEIY